VDERFRPYLTDSGATVGDESAVDCPNCGGAMSMQDIATDGCLKPGFEGTCEHCEAPFRIIDVEYSATVWVRAVAEEKTE